MFKPTLFLYTVYTFCKFLQWIPNDFVCFQAVLVVKRVKNYWLRQLIFPCIIVYLGNCFLIRVCFWFFVPPFNSWLSSPRIGHIRGFWDSCLRYMEVIRAVVHSRLLESHFQCSIVSIIRFHHVGIRSRSHPRSLLFWTFIASLCPTLLCVQTFWLMPGVTSEPERCAHPWKWRDQMEIGWVVDSRMIEGFDPC